VKQGSKVVTAFPIPDAAPPPVAEAYARFDQAAQKWATIGGELEEAEAGVEHARLEDAEAIAAQYEKDGSLPNDSAKHEREALARAGALRRLLDAAATTVDEAGNDLLGPIAEAREAWLAQLEAAKADALDAYQAGLADTCEALAEHQRLKAAVGWLERFDAGEARVGRVRGVHARGPHAFVEDHLGGEHDVTKLLELASHVGEPSAAERRAARHAEAEARSAEEQKALVTRPGHRRRSFA
jgi:hypothetical protein